MALHRDLEVAQLDLSADIFIVLVRGYRGVVQVLFGVLRVRRLLSGNISKGQVLAVAGFLVLLCVNMQTVAEPTPILVLELRILYYWRLLVPVGACRSLLAKVVLVGSQMWRVLLLLDRLMDV